MPDYTLSAKITGDSSGFDKAIQSAEKTASSFEKRMESISSKAKSIGDKLSGIGTALTVGVTTPLAVAGKGMVDAASDFDENLNKISVAFGDSADDVKAWADTATESFGLSMNQALEATSLFGDMATSMGISQSEAASMSTSLAGLAGDMASFKNIGIDEAMTALNGVFTGETESLKQLGIVMTEVNLQEFADGLGLVYDDMTQAEKVQLRYNYVMAMSKNAIGDYARTSDGTANSMRTFQASVENLAITLGQNLLPIVTPIIQKATEMVNAFAAADPELQQLVLKIAGIAAAAGPALLVIGKMVSVFGSASGAMGLLSGKIAALGGMKAALSGVFTAITGPVGIAVAAIIALVAAFAYLMTTNEGFRNSVMQTLGVLGESFQTVLAALLPVITQLATLLGEAIASVLQQLAPVIAQYVTMIAELWAQLAPMIAQLITELAPVITLIIENVSQIISTLLPPLISVIQAIMDAIKALMPVIMDILSVAIDVISSIIKAVTPIVAFVGDIISDIVAVITPIISKIANIISQVAAKIKPIASTVSGVFNNIFSTVSGIMSKVGSVVTNVFSSIKSAWSGLTGFVSGVFDGIGSAVESLVNQVKGFINGVIGGINAAIGLINKIPGVEISKIPELAHGTDNWQGGFAVMNEGGRGELTYLPNGAQVIPHDISVKYAKEAARTNRGAESLDLSGLMEGMVIQVINNTSVDGTPLRESISDYTIRKIGNQQKAVLKSKGAFAWKS